MNNSPPTEITRILSSLEGGAVPGDEATNRLYSLVYGELRRLAGGLMRYERPDHTLQPTALVNESYLRLVGSPDIAWQNRAHFFGVAASAMRQVLVEHARRRAAEKRGGNLERVTFTDALDAAADAHTPSTFEAEVLDLDRAMTRLQELDPRMAKVVELRVFAGMEVREVAHILGVSERTVANDWRVARMWLARELAN